MSGTRALLLARGVAVVSLIAVVALGSVGAVAQDGAEEAAAEQSISSDEQGLSEVATGETRNPVQQLPVVVFDRARVLSDSAAGQALEAEIEALRNDILAENNAISDALEAEERALAEERLTLSEGAFRAKADAFDQKVTDVRAEQDRKAAQVQAAYDEGIAELETLMNAALASVARELRAVIVLERQQVYLLSGSIDISAEVIRRLDRLASIQDADGEGTDDEVEPTSQSDTEAPDTTTQSQD
ncbi:OmpH family outer membrane protein [Celeribacter sp.]|uniref:OmpH family outer membrane protein n=1 Tax=Celeribacter sp. TaxID=1890673 RepID=UPI003A8D4142